jgi:hypothetical protein
MLPRLFCAVAWEHFDTRILSTWKKEERQSTGQAAVVVAEEQVMCLESMMHFLLLRLWMSLDIAKAQLQFLFCLFAGLCMSLKPFFLSVSEFFQLFFCSFNIRIAIFFLVAAWKEIVFLLLDVKRFCSCCSM